jgi:hypothetical protein
VNRNLLLLDAALLVAVIFVGSQFRGLYRQSQLRRSQPISAVAPPVSPVAFQPSATARVQVANYSLAIRQLLLDRSRNPEVSIEPGPAPAPEPPMPALPVYHGRMNLADSEGAIAILSTAANQPQKAIHFGQNIGQFKLLAVNEEGIDLEWRGQRVHRTLKEVMDHTHSSIAQTTSQRADIAGAPLRPPPPLPAAYGRGEEVEKGIARCIEADTTPAGSVQDGWRKVSKPGPFGPRCYWEFVGR